MSLVRSPAGLLVLIHRGASFVSEILAEAKGLGAAVFVLSSQAPASKAAELSALAPECLWLKVTDRDNLTLSDVTQAIATIEAEGCRVAACFTVWDGYRSLMAVGNAVVGARDLDARAMGATLDKLEFRNRLREAGLSSVRAELVTEDCLATLHTGARRFIKPRRGVASSATFELKPGVTWERLNAFRAEMGADQGYKAIFAEHADFIAEDFIEGREYCFECLAIAGAYIILGVNEKVDLEMQETTVLENACVSPPYFLAPSAIDQGCTLVERSLACLGADHGLFHVEARYREMSQNWELIEVNPRMGGGAIPVSIDYLTEGRVSLIRASLELLFAGSEAGQGNFEPLIVRYEAFDVRRFEPKTGCFFRVFYAEPDQLIQRIEVQAMAPEASYLKLYLTEGTRTPKVSREITLGCAAWRVPTEALDQVPNLIERSNDKIVTYYESQRQREIV